jgi:Mitochondrial carrier protein
VTAVPEVLSIMPLEIAKVALQLDSAKIFQNNMFNAMGAVMKDKGLMGFTAGYVGLQYRQAAWSAAYFASLPFFERKVNEFFDLLKIDYKRSPTARTISQLTSGFCAGVLGAAFNTPGDTIRTNVQKRLLGNLGGATTFIGCGKEIVENRVENRRFGALYSGFGFKAFHLV